MFVSNEEILKAIGEIQSDIAAIKSARRGLRAELLVEELSISKAAKLIHTTAAVLAEAVKRGELKALPHPNGNYSKLRVRVADLIQWQEDRAFLMERETDGELPAPKLDAKLIMERARAKVLGEKAS